VNALRIRFPKALAPGPTELAWVAGWSLCRTHRATKLMTHHFPSVPAQGGDCPTICNTAISIATCASCAMRWKGQPMPCLYVLPPALPAQAPRVIPTHGGLFPLFEVPCNVGPRLPANSNWLWRRHKPGPRPDLLPAARTFGTAPGSITGTPGSAESEQAMGY